MFLRVKFDWHLRQRYIDFAFCDFAQSIHHLSQQELEMKMIRVLALISCLGAIHSYANECDGLATAASDEATLIAKKYEQLIQSKAAEYESEGKQIEDDLPDSGAAEVAVGVDVEIGSKIQEIIMHLPSVTMKDQKLVLGWPYTTMRTQKYSWDNPTLVNKLRCVKGNPKVTCSGFSCTVKMDDICTKVPTWEMRKQEASWDVPSVTVKNKDLFLKIPEVILKAQILKMNMPTVTVKDVKSEFKEAERKGEELAQRSEKEFQEISNAMQIELDTQAVKTTSAIYSCNIAQIENQRDASLSEIDIQIKTLSASKAEAIKNNAASLATSFDEALTALVKARDEAANEFQKAIATLSEKNNSFIKKEVETKLDSLQM